jgi:hypothetical protein
LFEFRVLLVDHVEFPVTADDLALRTALFDGRFDFHGQFSVYSFRFPVSDSQFPVEKKQLKTED